MSILLARISLASGIAQINRIEQSACIHICNATLLLSKNMIRKNWNFNSKYFLGMAVASLLLLSSFGVLTHNTFANAMINSAQTTDNSNTVSSVQPSSNIKYVNAQTEINNKPVHVKSPSHIPPLILEQFMQSKICKNKCVHPKSP